MKAKDEPRHVAEARIGGIAGLLFWPVIHPIPTIALLVLLAAHLWSNR